MKDRIPEIVFLVILAALVAGFFLGRRKGLARFQAAMSNAKAEGHAEATTALAARLQQNVTVTAGNTTTGAEETDRALASVLAAYKRAITDGEFVAALNANDDDGAGLDNYDDLLLGTGYELHVPRSGDPLGSASVERDRLAIDRAPDPDRLESR